MRQAVAVLEGGADFATFGPQCGPAAVSYARRHRRPRSRPMKRFVLLSSMCVMVAACQEPRSPTGVMKPPSGLLVDGAHNSGNAHFYFLPPLVRQPSVSGVFNPSLRPTVEICELEVDAQGIPVG